MKKKRRHGELRRALHACAPYFTSAALFSAAINILYLASPLYMLQVYDRVLSSGSVSTLVMLSLALLIALTVMAVLDLVRARILIRAGLRLDRLLSSRILTALVTQANATPGTEQGQTLRSLDTFRAFITGPGAYTVFDTPWAPLYIVVLALINPLLGLIAFVFSLMLLPLAVINERITSAMLAEAGEAAASSYGFAEAGLRNSRVIEAMSMLGGFTERWSRDRNRLMAAQVRASDRGAALTVLIRALRLVMQATMLGIGAYFVIERVMTSGSMFASTILLARALLPIEQAVAAWRQFVGAFIAYRQIDELLNANPHRPVGISLPRPRGVLSAQSVTHFIPGVQRPVLCDVNFSIPAGESLGIIGPSGAGKSTLASLIVGIQPPRSGAVRLDGANVATWNRTDFGRHVGYLPQDVELFPDSVAANIARFGPADSKAIIEAATAAGAHELILALPQAYETQIGERGVNLSGGHRQRIALARALYGDPSLIVLDEPSSNLDMEGETALTRCLAIAAQRRQTVVVISHRKAQVNRTDKILVLREGAPLLFGPSQEVLSKIGQLPIPVAAKLAETA